MYSPKKLINFPGIYCLEPEVDAFTIAYTSLELKLLEILVYLH